MINHIFFDLDNTLWDFEKNSTKTLLELINQFDLKSKGIKSSEDFIRKYKIHNENLWSLYRKDKITKEELRGKRFLLTLRECGIDEEKLAENFGLEYIKQSPLKKELFPFTRTVLKYLKTKYKLHIITNGFEEVQYVKLKSSKIRTYFELIITSEQVGVKKPNPKIFHYALDKAKAKATESVMIGDDLLIDIHGAENVGMQAIYFNPKKKKNSRNLSHEILCLSELMTLF